MKKLFSFTKKRIAESIFFCYTLTKIDLKILWHTLVRRMPKMTKERQLELLSRKTNKNGIILKFLNKINRKFGHFTLNIKSLITHEWIVSCLNISNKITKKISKLKFNAALRSMIFILNYMCIFVLYELVLLYCWEIKHCHLK